MALPLITDPYTGASYVGYVNFTQPFNGTYFIEIRSSDNTLVSSQQEIPYILDVDYSTFKLASVETDQLFLDFPLLDCVIFSDVNDGSVYYSFSANYVFSSTSLSLGDFVFRDSAAFYRHFGIVDSLGGSVDLTPISDQLSLVQDNIYSMVSGAVQSINGYLGGRFDGFESQISGLGNSITGVHTHLDTLNVDLTPVIDLLTPLQTAELNNLHEDIVSLGTQLSTVTVSLQSLNGNGSEYKDGVQVLVTGRLPVYTVSRSYMSMMDTDTYTCVYDLEALDGSKTTCPESFLTPYVAPVVTTP